jgi:putative SOS response-associated peptidase YedK
MCNRYLSPDQADIEAYWDLRRHVPPIWETREVYPRGKGPFIRRAMGASAHDSELVIGQWGLIPSFAKEPKLPYSTNNARFEELINKASYKRPWASGQRCLIPAVSFDEPNWETGKNIWYRFKRRDGALWGLAGLWNTWVDKGTGEVHESYTMLTINADAHPLMSRMHRAGEEKRSVVPIERGDWEQWLTSSVEDAARLAVLSAPEVFDASPVIATTKR